MRSRHVCTDGILIYTFLCAGPEWAKAVQRRTDGAPNGTRTWPERPIGGHRRTEALKAYLEQPKASPRWQLSCTRICRVDKVMQPYLEALL